MNNQTEIPVSRQAMFRIALDVLIAGYLSGVGAYAATSSVKWSLITGTAGAAKALQSRLAPDLATMNKQRAVEKAEAVPVVVPVAVEPKDPVVP